MLFCCFTDAQPTMLLPLALRAEPTIILSTGASQLTMYYPQAMHFSNCYITNYLLLSTICIQIAAHQPTMSYLKLLVNQSSYPWQHVFK
jgi:hypothetical protein